MDKKLVSIVIFLLAFSPSLTSWAATPTPASTGMDKGAFNFCINMGKAVMRAQKLKQENPAFFDQTYDQWGSLCSLKAIIKHNGGTTGLGSIPAAPMEWAQLKEIP